MTDHTRPPNPPAERDPARPNILWICTDSQRWDTLGCTGNRFVRTPRIDRLAAEGALFDHAFTQSPLCTPSRGAFLTGRYPITNRLRQNGQVCPDDLRLIPRILADAGWVCGLSGKLHLSHCDQRLALGPEWWRENPKRWTILGSERRVHDGYHEFYWDHAASGLDPASAYTQWLDLRGARITREPRADCPLVEVGPPSELHQATFCADMAISFMRRHAGRSYPWLFSVNIFDPHYSFDPPADYFARYLDLLDEIPDPPVVPGELDDKPQAQRDFRANLKKYLTLDSRQHRMIRAAYWAMCDHLDVQVGRMLDALEATGQSRDTIVIFHSDHGELLGDHGVYIKDQFFYDSSIRVPLIWRWPGQIPAGQRSDELVELVDLAPTLIEAAGLPTEPGMQGRSQWRRLTGGEATPREDAFCEFLGAHGRARYASMLRTKEHKLVAVHGRDEGELYDLRADPGEHRNRWNDPACLGVKAGLLKRLADRLAFTADPLPPRVGVY
jgi:arylsulfatase A-like enzyme